MMLMPIYTAQWPMKAATKCQRQGEAEQVRLARALWLASEARQAEERSRPRKSALKRLLTSLGRIGA